MDRLETTYNQVLTRIFSIANPLKKTVKKTECKVHIFLNEHALDILLDSKYLQEYNLFNSYIWAINEGAVWADQDFKSSSHFYNPFKEKGLYGRKSALTLAEEYYRLAITSWHYGDFKMSMFYFGAAVHIIQDMTVPQHANIRLLDNHHQYESYIKKIYKDLEGFNHDKKPYILGSVKDYIRFNTRMALKVYRRYENIKEDNCRYFRISRCTLPLAKRTTAGAMLLFYNEINEVKT